MLLPAILVLPALGGIVASRGLPATAVRLVFRVLLARVGAQVIRVLKENEARRATEVKPALQVLPGQRAPRGQLGRLELVARGGKRVPKAPPVPKGPLVVPGAKAPKGPEERGGIVARLVRWVQVALAVLRATQAAPPPARCSCGRATCPCPKGGSSSR